MLFFILVIAILLLSVFYWYSTIPKNIPPQGPISLPFIGHPIRQYGGKLYLKIKEWGDKYGPIFSFYVQDQLVVVISDYELMKEAYLKQADFFVGKQDAYMMTKLNLNYGLLTSQGPLWKEQRRFALSTLRDFGVGKPLVENSIVDELRYVHEELLKSKGQELDLQNLLNNSVSNIICQLVFGRRFAYTDKEFQQVLNVINANAAGSSITAFFLRRWMLYLPWIQKYVKIRMAELKRIKDFVMLFIVKERNHSRENTAIEPSNYIQSFLKAQNDNTGHYFSDLQLQMSVFSLFTAGTETTSTTLRWAFLLCTLNPGVAKKVHEELDRVVGEPDNINAPNLEHRKDLHYTEAVLLEVQRFATLVPVVVRYMHDDVNINSYVIPKGSIVLRSNYSVHQNPNLYPEPERFIPERFLDVNGHVQRPEAFIPFGMGKRSCLGEALAKMELYMFFTYLMHKFNFSFSDKEPKPTVERIAGVTLQPKPFKMQISQRY